MEKVLGLIKAANDFYADIKYMNNSKRFNMYTKICNVLFLLFFLQLCTKSLCTYIVWLKIVVHFHLEFVLFFIQYLYSEITEYIWYFKKSFEIGGWNLRGFVLNLQCWALYIAGAVYKFLYVNFRTFSLLFVKLTTFMDTADKRPFTDAFWVILLEKTSQIAKQL